MAPGKVAWFGTKVLALVGKEIDRRQMAAGRAWLTKARELAPERTGLLKSKLGWSYRQSDHTLILYGDAPYEVWVEEGTRFARAQPHMRPALLAVARVWGGKTELSFPNTPNLKGTTRTPKPAVIAHNRRVHAALNRGRVRKAKYAIGRGQYNGPARPWEGT